MRAFSTVGTAPAAALTVFLLGSTTIAAGRQPSVSRSVVVEGATSGRAILDRYCVGCHNERMKANYAGLALDAIDLSKPGDRSDVWERVVRKLRAGLMPPAGRPRPDASAQE